MIATTAALVVGKSVLVADASADHLSLLSQPPLFPVSNQTSTLDATLIPVKATV
jgi:hypothetical protein